MRRLRVGAALQRDAAGSVPVAPTFTVPGLHLPAHPRPPTPPHPRSLPAGRRPRIGTRRLQRRWAASAQSTAASHTCGSTVPPAALSTWCGGDGGRSGPQPSVVRGRPGGAAAGGGCECPRALPPCRLTTARRPCFPAVCRAEVWRRGCGHQRAARAARPLVCGAPGCGRLPGGRWRGLGPACCRPSCCWRCGMPSLCCCAAAACAGSGTPSSDPLRALRSLRPAVCPALQPALWALRRLRRGGRKASRRPPSLPRAGRQRLWAVWGPQHGRSAAPVLSPQPLMCALAGRGARARASSRRLQVAAAALLCRFCSRRGPPPRPSVAHCCCSCRRSSSFCLGTSSPLPQVSLSCPRPCCPPPCDQRTR